MDFNPSVSSQALKRLESLDTSFKTHNMAILDAIEESQVEAEQETLDEHDDDVMNISLRLQAPNTDTVEATPIPNRILIGRRLAQLQARLLSEANTLSGDPAELHTYQEILAAELADVRKEAVVIAADSSDELSTAVRNQDKDIFNLSVKIKKLLYNPGYAMESLTTKTPEPHGSQELTLLRSMATCSIGKEQFDISVHSRKDVANAEKLAYLRHSLAKLSQ